jgi:hypothetical protein
MSAAEDGVRRGAGIERRWGASRVMSSRRELVSLAAGSDPPAAAASSAPQVLLSAPEDGLHVMGPLGGRTRWATTIHFSTRAPSIIVGANYFISSLAKKVFSPSARDVENIYRLCNATAFFGSVIGKIVAWRKSFFAPRFAVVIFGKLDVFLSRFAKTWRRVRRGKRAQIALFVCTEEKRVAFLLLLPQPFVFASFLSKDWVRNCIPHGPFYIAGICSVSVLLLWCVPFT